MSEVERPIEDLRSSKGELGSFAGADMSTGLIWGIKRSFLAYLSRMPDLKSSVSGGASVAPELGLYHFPLASSDAYDYGTGQGTLKFQGDLRFSGHFGFLFVMLVDPWVTFDDGLATLSFHDVEADPELADDSARRPMLGLGYPGYVDAHGIRDWQLIPTSLRTEAVSVFNEVYPPGELFEPLHMRVTL
ncbi:HtaA domain-containing protein [Nocardioides sp. WS12]|uniref:HtaA domain-containing protein n=1 Tax=Nocardioides sp. WS12 TaxID=2486272 RepID=UPI0015F8B3EF|nr:HtaA domain-containing protein [Nocardioides sp. WS12]